MLHGPTPVFLKSSLISLSLYSLTPPYDKWQGYETPTYLVWISSLCWAVYIEKLCHLSLTPAQSALQTQHTAQETFLWLTTSKPVGISVSLDLTKMRSFSGSPCWALFNHLAYWAFIFFFSFKSVVFGLHLVLVSCNFLAANPNPELESLRMEH